MNEKQMKYIRTHCFHVESPCGRAWEVPMISVLRDYMIFQAHMELEENGTRTRKQILQEVDIDDIKSWFYDQYNWETVEHQGKLVKSPTPQQVTRALDMARGTGSFDSKIIPSLEQQAKITRRKLRAVAGHGQQDSETKTSKQPKI